MFLSPNKIWNVNLFSVCLNGSKSVSVFVRSSLSQPTFTQPTFHLFLGCGPITWSVFPLSSSHGDIQPNHCFHTGSLPPPPPQMLFELSLTFFNDIDMTFAPKPTWKLRCMVVNRKNQCFFFYLCKDFLRFWTDWWKYYKLEFRMFWLLSILTNHKPGA